VYISQRRGGGPVAPLHPYAPRCPADLERFFARPPDAPAFSNTPRGSSTPTTFRFVPAGLAGLAF
jgi:hypothetical protein